MHILILESRLTGHHPVYLEKIFTGLVSDGHKVTMAFSSLDAGFVNLSKPAQPFAKTSSVHLIDHNKIQQAHSSKLGTPGRELAMRRLFRETFKQVDSICKVDHVLLPYLDYCLYAIALFGSPFGATPWSGISMRPSFHYPQCGVIAPSPKFSLIKERLFYRLLRDRTLKKLLTIDETLYEYITHRHQELQSRICYLPDPAELHGYHTYETARARLNIKEGQKIILVYGSIDARKGIEELLYAFAHSDMPNDIGLLVVGKQSHWAKSKFSGEIGCRLREQGRLYELDLFVDDDTQHMAFSAADLIWLGYKEHYAMSGVLVLASLAGKPVVATNEGLIGWYTKRQELGTTLDLHSPPSDLAKSITQALKMRPNTSNFPTHNWNQAIDIITKSVAPNSQKCK